jgi:heme exporter protein D
MSFGATAHLDFIAAAYTAAVIIIGALIAWVTLDYRTQKNTLLDLDKRGIRRRPGPARPDAAIHQAKEEA